MAPWTEQVMMQSLLSQKYLTESQCCEARHMREQEWKI